MLSAKPPILNWFLKQNSGRFALKDETDTLQFLLFDLADTNVHTKFPTEFLEKCRDFNQESSLLLSIRIQDIMLGSNRRYSLDYANLIGSTSSDDDQKTYAAKDTRSATKSNPPDCICSGNIPEDDRFRLPSPDHAYKPMDNNMRGNFPLDASTLPADDAIVLKLRAYNPDILEIKKIGNLLCYSAKVPKYAKPSKDAKPIATGETVTKHFIQAHDSLRRIINRLIDDIYKELHIAGTIISFTDNLGNRILFDLQQLIPSIDTSKLAIHTVTNLESLAQLIKDNEIVESHVPLFYVSEDKALPIMLHSGDNGFAITGDADFEHLGILPGLPLEAHCVFDTKTQPPGAFLEALRICSENMPEWPVYKQKLTGLTEIEIDRYENVYQDFRAAVQKCYEEYSQFEKQEELRGLGASSVYSFVMQKYFEHALWIHGAEDIHPAAKPEKFGGVLSFWKGHFFVTGDEKSYLDFLLHDPAILRSQEIGVHPYWLDSDRPDSKADDWLDIIAIQALNRYNQTNNLEEYKRVFENLKHRINGIDRVNNAMACKKIDDLSAHYSKQLQTQPGLSLVKAIYDKYQDRITAFNARKDERIASYTERQRLHLEAR